MTKEGLSYSMIAFAATILFLMLSRSTAWEPLRYAGWACALLTVLLLRSHRRQRRETGKE